MYAKEKPNKTLQLTFSGEILNAFPLRSGTGEDVHTHYLFLVA